MLTARIRARLPAVPGVCGGLAARGAALFREAHTLLRSASAARAVLFAGFLLASAVSLALGRSLHSGTAAAWVYLPLVLLVTIRWGVVPGLGIGALAGLFVLTSVVSPLGLPLANDPYLYIRLIEAALGTLVAVVTVGTLNRRLMSAERHGRTAAEEARAEAEALMRAISSLSAQEEPEAILRALVEQAVGLIDAERAHYALPWSGRIVIRGRWSEGRWMDDDHEPRRTGGILAWILENGRPFRSNALPSDPLANKVNVERQQIRSQLTAPLIVSGGELIGFVGLQNCRRPEGFTERDERLMVAICETGAAILRRAQETAARLGAEREVAALLTVAERLNATADPEDVLLRVVEVAGQLLAVRRVAILSNEGDHVLHRHDWSAGSWTQTNERLPLDSSFSGWVITHARSYRSDDVAQDSNGYRPLQEKSGTARVLAVPVRSRSGPVTHALCLFDPSDGRPFSDEDQRLAEGIAHHCSVALERATLVDQLRDRERHLHHQAVTDPLTGLPNRRLFLDRLCHALSQVKRRGHGVAVLFLDLDGFKDVNDSLGHAAGDHLLQGVAQRLIDAKRAEDTVARFGGDEFAVLLTNVPNPATALRIADRISHELERPFSLRKRERVAVTASIGVSFRQSPGDMKAAEELLREGDIALYQAKSTTKGRAMLFEPAMSAIKRLDLQMDLQRALTRGEFLLHYQPVVRLDTGALVGVEALVRWQHPQRGLLAPAEFIPMAEETALILSLGRWVLEESCRQAVAWQSTIPSAEPLRMCVNLSARQFEQPKLLALIASTLEDTGLDPAALELEITETAVIRSPETAIATLHALRKLGVRVAIDDFGTGYSSLSYLQQLPIDTLKIDRSFVDGLQERGTAAAIVQATTTMAHALGMDVTAEGIETQAQLSAIAKLGCDYGQGYLFSVPLPADEAGEVLKGEMDGGKPRLIWSRAKGARPTISRHKLPAQDSNCLPAEADAFAARYMSDAGIVR